MRERFAVAASLCAMAALIFCSDQVIISCRYALSLCCELIIPSLFPFFLLSILMNRLGIPAVLGRITAALSRRLFGVSGAGGTAFFMGLCGGYPLGAAYIADMYQAGAVEQDEAEHLLGFCNNSGPAFLIGAVGTGIFNSTKAGLYLYLVHIMSAAIIGMIMGIGSQSRGDIPEEKTVPRFAWAFTDTVRQAVVSILNVCGYVVCFTVLVGLLDADGFFSLITGRLSWLSGAELHWVRSLLTGFLELGSGVGQMQGLGISPINLALAAFLVGWGGISVHFQTMAQIAGTELEGKYHFAGRLMSGSIGAVIAYFGAGVIFMP